MPGFTDGWKLAPRLARDADSMDVKLHAYEATAERQVGRRIADDSDLSVSCFDVTCAFLWADAGTWAEHGGVPLVLGKKDLGDKSDPAPIWVDRTALEDPRYRATLHEIAATAAAEDVALLREFWSALREEIQSSPTVRLPDPFDGFNPTTQQTVHVPAGTYDKVAIRDGDFALPNIAPFYLVIRLTDDAIVAISPSALRGVGSPVADEGPTRMPSGPVSAAELRAAFAATRDHVRRHIPDRVWLTEEQIHYVEPDEMGAAHVLERIPEDAAEVARVKQDATTHDAFIAGMSTPGLRLGDHILVLKTMVGTGTEYHEAVHQRSHDTFRKTFGSPFNEGVTEYFTRIVIAELLPRCDSPYEPQLAGANALVTTGAVTEAELAGAYFAGRLAPLYAGFDRVTRGAVSFQAFVERQGAATAHIAQELLERAAAG